MTGSNQNNKATRKDGATPKKGKAGPTTRKTASSGGGANRDVVFDVLRERIADHQLPPGSKLRESELASEFGVSRTRIREALGALEQRGLIERIPNRGAIISRVDLKQASALYDLREYLEALGTKRATLNAPDGAWDDMLAAIDSLTGKVLGEEEFDTYLAYLEDLRHRILKYADNPMLTSMLDLIYDKSQVIARRVIILPGRSGLALKLHHEMISAMIARDADKAEALRREILRSAREMLAKYSHFVL